MKTLKNILFLLILVVMILPAVQKEWPFVKETKLNGAFIEKKQPEFSWKGFFKGSYQNAYEPYLEQHIGFHNTLVRLRNQLDYSLLRKPNAEGIIIGKKDFIFEYDYIRAITGRDYVGYSFVDEKLRRLKYVQEYLKKTKNIDLVLVFMPGKASFYREYIPDKYFKKVSDSTNYSVYLSEIIKRGIRYVDLNYFFHQAKKDAPYPMFPKYGTHWSIYGMSRAAHVWLDSIEQFRGEKLNDFNTDSLYFSTVPLRTDYDGGKALNLLCNLSKEKFAYPYYVFGHDSTRYKPHVLVIGDSFYWNIFNSGIPKNLFANEAFWYYNDKVYPDFYIKPKYTRELNLKKEVETKDLIFIMVTERFLNIFDWKFIDQLYYLYTPDYIKDPVYDYMNEIVRDANWFNNVLKKALAKGETPARSLYENAIYMYRMKHPELFWERYGMDYFKNHLTGSPAAKLRLEAKAIKENRPFETVLSEEAAYLFSKKHPETYKKYLKIAEKEQLILDDPVLRDSIWSLADQYYCRRENMLYFQAKQMARGNESD